MEEQKKYKAFSLAGRLFRDYVKKYLSQIVLGSVLLIICSAALSAQPLILKLAFEKIFNQKDVTYLTLIPLAIIGIFLVQAVTTYFAGILFNRFVSGITARMRQDLFRHVIDYEISFHSKNSSGGLISRLISETLTISNAVSTLFNVFFRQILTSIGLIAVMLYQSVELSFVSLIAFAFAYYPLMRIAKRLKKLAKQHNEKYAEMSSVLFEKFSGIRVIKAFGQEGGEIARTNEYINDVRQINMKSAKVAGITAPMMQILAGMAVAFVIWYGGHELIEGDMTEPDLVAFITSLLMVSRPLRSIGSLSGSLTMGLAATERFYQVIDQKPDHKSRDEGTELKVSGAEIKFNNLIFNYPDGTLALDGINIKMESGKSTALVGHSGSGKSTILNLIMKFYSPTSGKITIDGQDAEAASINSVRRNIALVSQDIFIFDDTARANIAYGLEGATEEQIVAAAKAAYCHDFIMSLPNGYDTKLGSFGEKLSGGQKQRIAIARAFLRNAPILLLDEATSALDPKTEADIQAALDELTKNRTTVIIAHRLSTVIKADKMIMLEKGKVLAEGSHKELLNKEEYRILFGL